jgi:hypothetical protein
MEKAPPAYSTMPQWSPKRERIHRIRLAGYLQAELRGFQPGREAEHWAAAELQVDAEIAAEYARAEPRSR